MKRRLVIILGMVLFIPNFVSAQGSSLYERSHPWDPYSDSLEMSCAPLDSQISSFTTFLRRFDAQSAIVDTQNWDRDIFSWLNIYIDSNTKMRRASFKFGKLSSSSMPLIQGITPSAVLGLSEAAVEVFSNYADRHAVIHIQSAAVVINQKYALVGALASPDLGGSLSGSPRYFFCVKGTKQKILNADELQGILKDNYREIQAGVENLSSRFTNALAQSLEIQVNQSPLFPNVDELLKTFGLYTTSDRYISGQQVLSAAKVVTAAVILQRLAAIAATAMTRNSVAALILFPDPQNNIIRLDLNKVGLTENQVRNFLAIPSANQRAKCLDQKYAPLCSELKRLDSDIFYALGGV